MFLPSQIQTLGLHFDNISHVFVHWQYLMILYMLLSLGTYFLPKTLDFNIVIDQE